MPAFAQRLPSFRRLSPLLLVLGGLAMYFGIVAPNLGTDHEVIIQFAAPPHATRADLVWTGRSVHAGEPVAGSTFHFPEPPRELRSVVHAPEGIYTMELSLDGPDGATTFTRTVELRGDSITIFLPPHGPPPARSGP